jgi:hypothetical protein
MMNFKKLFLTAATAVVWASIQPGTLSAQTSGVGTDGYTRVLWRGTDGRVSVWKVDANLQYSDSKVHGPFDGWTPLSLAVSSNNRTYLLWRNTNGSASIWWLDQNLGYGYSVSTDAYPGWLPETLSVSTASPYDIRVIWKNTNGSLSIWTFNADLVYQNAQGYPAYFGYDPGPASAAVKGQLLRNQSSPSSDGDARAAAAMKAQGPSVIIPMPQIPMPQ